MWGPLGVLFFLTALVSFALSNFQGIFGLYALEEFGFGTQEVGWIMTGSGGGGRAWPGSLDRPIDQALRRRAGDAGLLAP